MKSSARQKLPLRLPFLIFLAFYLLFSFFTFRDYGVTWDETDTYQAGVNLNQYLLHHAPLAYMDPEHGYPYSFILSFFTAPTNYETLHLLNLLFAGFLFWMMYELLLAEYKDPLWATAGPLFLFLFLPFLGSIPANPKDVPFAIFYFLSLSVLYLYPKKFPQQKFGWFFFGVLSGVTISARIVGFTLFTLMVFYDGFRFLTASKKEVFNSWIGWKALQWTGSFLVSQVVCATLWPYIGLDYFHNLPVVMWVSAHFPPKFQFLFNGGITDAISYPWYCLPLWIGVMTPLFILAFFLGAFFYWKKWKTNPLLTLAAAAFVLNIGLYFLLHPAIYDGIRHFLFLLPMMSLLASITCIEFLKKRPWKTAQRVVGGLALFGMVATAVELARLHPYEYAYFNQLVGGVKGAYGKYETDYWVASLKEAVEWLQTHELTEPKRVYKVCAFGHPPQYKIYFSPNMQYVEKPQDADYTLLMNRTGAKPEPQDEPKVIHRVEREGAPFCFILKMN